MAVDMTLNITEEFDDWQWWEYHYRIIEKTYKYKEEEHNMKTTAVPPQLLPEVSSLTHYLSFYTNHTLNTPVEWYLGNSQMHILLVATSTVISTG